MTLELGIGRPGGGVATMATDAPSGVIEALVAEADRSRVAALLPEFTIERRPSPTNRDRLAAIVTWSHSRRRGQARRRAAASRVPCLLLGGGLLRAPPGWGGRMPVLSATAYSVVGPISSADFLDPMRLLSTRGWEHAALLARAAAARRDIVWRRLAGAWWRSKAHPGLPKRDSFALIIADSDDDRGAGTALWLRTKRAMLEAALAGNSPERVVLLAGEGSHGDAFISEAAARGCVVLTGAIDIWEAIDRAGAVYTAGGESGFLALLAGAKVRCFFECFYSGWGITADAPGIPSKPFCRTIDELFAGACLVATRYLDPYRLRPASFEDALDIVGSWRSVHTANRDISVCVGMSFWKRRQVRDFLRSTNGDPVFRRSARAALAKACARPSGAIAVWASRIPAGLAKAAAAHSVPLIRVEDGFIRSVGLGSDFMPAASLVFDRRGMHFDPSVRSDLEILLAESEFDSALIERARALIAVLVARGVTKYNLGQTALSIAWPAGRTRLLVPGQVEDDLSVRLGGNGVDGNLELLARVRAPNPTAFILYKPHPDVEAGHRRGRIPDAAARRFADLVIRDVSTAALLGEIDELHTLTSLAGFEALLRHKRVVTYGRPFYAGWGLTTDLAQRDRGRQLALEELVAGALILYPRYLDPVSRLPCGPELVIERLEDPELWRPGVLVLARRLQGLLARRWSEHSGKSSAVLAALSRPVRRDEPGARQV
jgi:capsular polysaccharide export protein